MRKHLPLIIFAIIHIVICIVFYYTDIDPNPQQTDIRYYFDISTKMAHGQLPYRDFAIEYPPLALIFILLPRLFTSHQAIYGAMLGVEMIIFNLAGLVFIAALCRRLKLNVWASLVIATAALLSVGSILLQRYDIIPAVMTLASLYFFFTGKHKTAWAILAFATMTKLYPALLAPLYLFSYLKQKQWRAMTGGVISYAATAIAIIVPCLLLSPGGFLKTFTFHIGRNLQVESLYSSILLFGQSLGLTTVKNITGSGSVNITSPLADNLASIFLVFMAVCLLAAYWSFWRRQGRTEDPEALIDHVLLVVLIFILTNKILSPQYIIWLYPLVPVALGRWRQVSWLMFVLTGMLTRFIFPDHYNQLVQLRSAAAIDILLWRNMLLIAWGCLLIGDGFFTRKGLSPPGPDSIEKVVP